MRSYLPIPKEGGNADSCRFPLVPMPLAFSGLWIVSVAQSLKVLGSHAVSLVRTGWYRIRGTEGLSRSGVRRCRSAQPPAISSHPSEMEGRLVAYRGAPQRDGGGIPVE
jgi:hypothetical protein